MVSSRELFAGRWFAETTTLGTMLEPPTHSRLTHDRDQDLTIVALSNQNTTARSNLADTVTTVSRRRLADLDHTG